MNQPMAAVLAAHAAVLTTVVAELVALLTPEQRALLRERMREHAQLITPLPELEPDYSEHLRMRYADWIDNLAPLPQTGH